MCLCPDLPCSKASGMYMSQNRQQRRGDVFFSSLELTNTRAQWTHQRSSWTMTQIGKPTTADYRRTGELSISARSGTLVELNVGMECICVVPPAERPRWVILAAVLSHSKHMAVGWLSKPLSSICIIWVFCLHLSSVLWLKALILLPFASLLGSEENNNNEAWRPSTASHTNIHTYNTVNTDSVASKDIYRLPRSVV